MDVGPALTPFAVFSSLMCLHQCNANVTLFKMFLKVY